jgi:hypothetical protein
MDANGILGKHGVFHSVIGTFVAMPGYPVGDANVFDPHYRELKFFRFLYFIDLSGGRTASLKS